MLTKEQAVTKHKEMWMWIYEQTLLRKIKVSKGSYFISYFNNREIRRNDLPYCDCFCCEYAVQIARSFNEHLSRRCKYCPIEWGLGGCMEENALYNEWENTSNVEYNKAAELALKIANLPLKEE